MPVSRLLVPPEPAPAQPRPAMALTVDHLGLAPLPVADPAPHGEAPDSDAADPARFATAIGPLGPVRAARWNRQLAASAGVSAGAPTAAAGASSPND